MRSTTNPFHSSISRSGALRAVIAIAAGVLLSVSAAQADECFKEAKKSMEGSPAFVVSCTADTDCEFMPATAQNASAIAVVDATAAKIQNCWLESGLSKMTALETPAEMKVHVLRYMPEVDANTDGTAVCTIAEFKPVGIEAPTTTFRAQCKNK